MNQGNLQPRHDDLAAMQKQTEAQEKEFRQQQRLEQGDQQNEGYVKRSRDNSADSARSRSRSANERKRNYQQQQQQQLLSQQGQQENQGEQNQNGRNNRFQNSETTQQQQFGGMNFNASNLQQLNEMKMDQSAKGDLQQGYRHARRLYIGNIPETINQEYLSEWLYRSLEAAGGLMPLLPSENPIVKCDIDPKGRFAFTELRSVEETTALLQLDGIILWHRQLRIRRPTEYEKFPSGQSLSENIPKLNFDLFKTVGIVIIPTVVEDGPNKIFLANLPTKMDELMILDELKLRDMGEIKAFHLVKDNQTNQSKGYAFFEFKDHSLTDSCIEALHGMQYAGRTLTCKRSQIGGAGNKQPTGNRGNNNNGGGKQQGGMGRQMFGQDLMMDPSMGMQSMMMGIAEGNQYFQSYAQTMGQVGMGGFNQQKGMNQGGYNNNNNGNNNNKRRNYNNNNNNNYGQNYGGNQGNGGNRRYPNGGNQGQGQWDSFDS